jgi:hypothetical protein
MISGQVRFDFDMDGDLTDPDPGIPGITIELWTDPNGDGDPSDGMKISMTVTDANGEYTFTSVPPGKYVIVEIDFPTHDSTGDAAGANDNRVPLMLMPAGNAVANDFLDAGDELCNDGVDNDFDDDVDCDDAFCETLPLCTIPTPVMSPQLVLGLVALLLLVAAWGLGRFASTNNKRRS